jgi:hypothetical protein
MQRTHRPLRHRLFGDCRIAFSGQVGTEDLGCTETTVDWGDGSAVEDATLDCGSSGFSGTVSGTHTYAAPGTYT